MSANQTSPGNSKSLKQPLPITEYFPREQRLVPAVKITFGLGTSFKGDGSSIGANEYIMMLNQAKQKMIEMYDAYTLTQISGGWRNSHKKLVEESGISLSVTIELTESNLFTRVEEMRGHESKAVEVAESLKNIFYQEAVYLEVQEVRMALVK